LVVTVIGFLLQKSQRVFERSRRSSRRCGCCGENLDYTGIGLRDLLDDRIGFEQRSRQSLRRQQAESSFGSNPCGPAAAQTLADSDVNRHLAHRPKRIAGAVRFDSIIYGLFDESPAA
jgi:hypothetical protein